MPIIIVKYTSAVLILVAMVLHVAGITPWNSIVQMLGAAGWIWVGYKWKEKSIILNFCLLYTSDAADEE